MNRGQTYNLAELGLEVVDADVVLDRFNFIDKSDLLLEQQGKLLFGKLFQLCDSPEILFHNDDVGLLNLLDDLQRISLLSPGSPLQPSLGGQADIALYGRSWMYRQSLFPSLVEVYHSQENLPDATSEVRPKRAPQVCLKCMMIMSEQGTPQEAGKVKE